MVCDADWGWLDRLRDHDWPKDEEEKYYACREKVIDPYQFMAIDDEAVILTGRPLHLKEVTEKWLKKNGMGGIPVIFTKTLKKYPTATKTEFLKLGLDKAMYCIENGIQVHFEDNEQVVESMRTVIDGARANVVVIHAGWHVSW